MLAMARKAFSNRLSTSSECASEGGHQRCAPFTSGFGGGGPTAYNVELRGKMSDTFPITSPRRISLRRDERIK
ncbi:hypothetical protein MULP_00991 [Mycobacterium liflandii 128FXT]|uniref:Uncharacterized protein n=1 Tax=Mycobacterium liflandii (strain 128FXT) TaxID=459424 RepID=L7V3B3_MYCL1|nr:hypothetical protein MULP_00991 [Mycobacterium liflandii 128FXT]RFZ55752.1 hypothetical protein BB170200_03773 [Mycobacterium marinum]